MTTRRYSRTREKNLTKEILGESGNIDTEEYYNDESFLPKEPAKIKIGDIFPRLAQLSANGSDGAT